MTPEELLALILARSQPDARRPYPGRKESVVRDSAVADLFQAPLADLPSPPAVRALQEGPPAAVTVLSPSEVVDAGRRASDFNGSGVQFVLFPSGEVLSQADLQQIAASGPEGMGPANYVTRYDPPVPGAPAPRSPIPEGTRRAQARTAALPTQTREPATPPRHLPPALTGPGLAAAIARSVQGMPPDLPPPDRPPAPRAPAPQYPAPADMTFVRPANPPAPSDRGQVVTDYGPPRHPVLRAIDALLGR